MILPKFALKSLEARDSRFAKAAAGMSLVNDHHNLTMMRIRMRLMMMLVIRIFIINRITMSIQYDYKDDKAKADDDDATQKITNYNANEDDGNGRKLILSNGSKLCKSPQCFGDFKWGKEAN